MKDLTCVIVGGGFAGIHAIKAIRKAYEDRLAGGKLRLILIDKQTYHLRKVLLFRPAVNGEEITVPWERMLPDCTQFIQGSVVNIDSGHKKIHYKDPQGVDQWLDYDLLVLSVGSVGREPALDQGGIALTSLTAAREIQMKWRMNLQHALTEPDQENKRRLMTAAVAGAGITGIETSAELAYAMKAEAAKLGLDPSEVCVHLLNSSDRLFPEGPWKVGRKLEQSLILGGVTVHHRIKALQEDNGYLKISEGAPLSVGLVVWTLGLSANPVLRFMDLLLTPEGQVIVDESYRVREKPGIYCIGDCAYIVDPINGKTDRMTCKEAIFQANRLGAVIMADITGRPAPQHKAVIESFVVALGPDNGLCWARKWGIDIIITGNLGYKIKLFLWNKANLLR